MLIKGRNIIGSFSISTLMCMQLSCSTNDLKIFGSEEIEPDASPPVTTSIDPIYEKAEEPESDKPKIRNSSQNKPSEKKKRVVREPPANTSKAIEVSKERVSADNDLDDSKTDVTRLPSRAKALNVAADNTRINRLQDGDPRLSADQQGNSRDDIEITRKIRRRITSTDGLSIYARNVKIITRDGQVVLKGPVRSEDERKFVENSAVEIAGLENVASGIGVMAGGR